FSWLIKEEKAWFFLLCGYQPKINELIFLVFYLSPNESPATSSALSFTSRGAEHPFVVGSCHQKWVLMLM
ncbi:hypothetical protein, partial [Serratia ureilytica]|uniref:hypothetical protein n=1 Tax=Serratia ureilytica TaxID=300181 RepID=UPI003FA7BB4E